MTVGYAATTRGDVIDGDAFEDVNIGILVSADHVTIRRCTFRRLRSDGTNGCAIAVQYGVVGCRILDNDIDNEGGAGDSAALFLYPGSSAAIVRGNVIANHPQVGIACGSTTYVEFPAPLPWSDSHLLEGNVITRCGHAKTGDAGAGIAVVGMSHRIVTRQNTIRRCGGHGIVYAGSVQGSGASGTPAFDESPTWGSILGNICEYNGGTGIRNSGANYTWIKDNLLYSNAGGGVVVVGVGGSSDARGVVEDSNRVG